MIGSTFAEKAKEYAILGLEYFERENSGRILECAKQDLDIAKEIANKYLPELSKLDPFVRGILKSTSNQPWIYPFRDQMIDTLVAELAGREGELGQVAREYPEWLRDHMRRVFNLAVLHVATSGKI